MRYFRALAIAYVLMAGMGPALAADDVAPFVFIAKLFGKVPGPGLTNICFNRDYDAAHLAQHPLQKVTSMMIEISNVPASKQSTATISFSIGVRLRGSASLYTSGGNCSLVNSSGLDNGLVDKLQCSVDCDGGGITFRLPQDDASVYTELEKGEHMSMGKANDMDHGISLVRGADDRLFKLDRTDVHACLPVVQDDDIKASIRRTK